MPLESEFIKGTTYFSDLSVLNEAISHNKQKAFKKTTSRFEIDIKREQKSNRCFLRYFSLSSTGAHIYS